ncbi:MAG: hypothetical protein LBV16_06185 [Elusimicrobiota bacterium]|nr:hypothetical protein [Elusimicrobiota bacterium]
MIKPNERQLENRKSDKTKKSKNPLAGNTKTNTEIVNLFLYVGYVREILK